MPLTFEKEVARFYTKLEKSPIRVRVISHTPHPYDLAPASARTCYSSKGLLLPEEMEASREIADKVARQTLKAGHLTTRQHAHFVFGIEGVSRRLIWQFLHAHPFYNSEQVSQRYVPIKKNRRWYTLPAELDFEEIHEYHENLHSAYEQLISILEPKVSEIYFSLHKIKALAPEKYRSEVRKKAMEVARYVMPLSTNAYLYHTISLLTLLRYAYLMDYYEDEEAKILTLKMLQAALEVDPRLKEDIPPSLPPGAPKPFSPKKIRVMQEQFDEKLAGKRSLLVSYTPNGAEKLKEIMDILCPSSGMNDVKDVLSPQRNPLLADTLYPTSLDPLSRALNHIHFTFAKKLSHTADSQEQRHRTLPGSRPRLEDQLSLEKDFIIPTLLEHSEEAKKFYLETMDYIFSFIKDQYARGISPLSLTYLLPNAFPVRYYESGDLLYFFHKWKTRLCYNAQEEIFYSSLDEAKQAQQAIPELEGLLGAPCYLREMLKPRCPEGDHFCGIKVWQLPLAQYQRIL
ncbi:MAG: FAD-dependent thymidylate synthase [Leptospiraceae bacterium]|nr:FAD-dependent thymidylate synthase [Leptospiraceae bacterium]MDW8307655.1 FAD-dependent thymidylate synthase [Leptospiraceae bacterium]